MNSDLKKAVDFADKHRVEIEVIQVDKNHKHPHYEGIFLDLYTVRVSRGGLSFEKRWSLNDLNLEDENFTTPDLIYGVLSRIPTYLFPSFEEYKKEVGAESEEEIRIAGIWYQDEMQLYEHSKRLFSDIFEELDEVFFE